MLLGFYQHSEMLTKTLVWLHKECIALIGIIEENQVSHFNLLSLLQDVTTPDMVVHVKALGKGENLFVGATFSVYIDEHPLLGEECPTLVEALVLAVELIHLMNLEYPKARKCWQILAEIICLIPRPSPRSIGLQRLINM